MGEAGKILKNLFSLSFAELVSKGAAFVYLAFLASTLGPENYGVLSFAKSTVVYFILIGTLGFDIVGIREIAKNHHVVQKYTNSILTLRLVLSILTFSALFYCVYYSGILADKTDLEKSVIMVAGLQIFANALLLNFVYQGLEKMEIVALRTILINLINLLGVIFIITNKSQTLLAMAIISGSQLLNAMLMVLYYIKDYGIPKLSFDLKLWASIFSSSLFIGLNNLLVTIYNNVDTTMIGILRDNYQTGIYSPAHQVIPLAVLPALIMNGVLMPQYSKNLRNNKSHELMRNSTKYNFILSTFVSALMFIFSDLIVHVISKEYTGSSIVLKVLAFNVLAMYLSINYTTPLIAWGYEKKVFWAILSGVVANIIVNFLLIPPYGAVGAAIATIATEGSVMFVLMYFYKKQSGKAFIFDSLRYVYVSILGVVPGALMLYLGINIWISFFTCLISFVLLNLAFKTVSIKEIKGYIVK